MTESDQRNQWDLTYNSKTYFFGESPSDLGFRSVDIFRKNGCKKNPGAGLRTGEGPLAVRQRGIQCHRH